MRRALLSAGLGLTLCATLALPAGAARGDDGPTRTTEVDAAPTDARPIDVRPTDVRPTDVRPTDVRPTDVRPTDVRPTDVRPTDVRPTDVRPTDVRPTDVPDETVRLSCNGRVNDAGRAAVGCSWSAATHRAAAGYVLVRTNGDTRTTVFATRDLTETSAVDTEIRFGVAYTYVVLVVNAAGETIGSGGPVVAGVREPDVDVDVMSLDCEAVVADTLAARCHWRPTTADDAVGYQLWRIVNRDHRELVWRGGLDQTSVGDLLPDDTVVVRYAVLAVDIDGEVVGQSRPVTLRFRDHDDDRPDRDRLTVRRSISAAHSYR